MRMIFVDNSCTETKKDMFLVIPPNKSHKNDKDITHRKGGFITEISQILQKWYYFAFL